MSWSAAALAGCRFGHDSRFQDWSFVFSLGDKKRHGGSSNVSNAKAVSITVKSRRQGEALILEGNVQQLFKRKEHHGLIIELFGIISTGNRCHQLLLPEAESIHKSSVFQQLWTGLGSLGYYVTNPYEKFPFTLTFPLTDCKGQRLPPSCVSSFLSVQYKLVVFMRVNDTLKVLGEKEVNFPGQLNQTISPEQDKLESPSIIKKEFSLPDCDILGVIELTKTEFLLKDEIPFTIRFRDEEGSFPIRKISVLLVQTVRRKEQVEKFILDCVTFKRFLKRKEFSRSGKFKASKLVPSASYQAPNRFGLRVDYWVEVAVCKKREDAKFVESARILMCTDEFVPIFTAPEEEELVPEVEDGEEEEMGAEDVDGRSALPVSFRTWATSILSVLPPTYSQLPSRAGSVISLETLPPNYDDLEFPEKEEPEQSENT